MKFKKWPVFMLLFIFAGFAQLFPGEKGGAQKTALLLIDIQEFYFPGGALPLSNPEAAALQAKKVLEKFRQKEMPVIHVRHNAKQGAAIHEYVKPLEQEKVFSKNFANSFRDTGLLDYLRGIKVDRLVLCGMQTHMCLEAATRAAADFGFKCTVIGDACATRDLTFGETTVKAAHVHASTLATLSGTYAEITDTETFLKEFK